MNFRAIRGTGVGLVEEKQPTDCLQRIRDIYSRLNTAERKAAQYILENPGDIIHYSITEVAENSSVSETTIFRLCNKLGYRGYQELKISLAGTLIEPIQNIHEEIKENDDMYIIMNKVFTSNQYSMKKTLDVNEAKTLAEAVKFMLKARQILFFGMGGSGAIAFDAYHKFIRTGIECSVHTDSHLQAMFAAMAKKNDVVMAISNSGSNKDLVEAIGLARKNEAKIIAITGNPRSPLTKVSDLVLVSFGQESMFRSEAMESRLSALMLIDCLYAGVALQRKEETLATLGKIREGIATKRF
ncbi:putative HTH-type transcriptional regulator YbbH [Peptococcaceae bacterium CEB3]|nr:putative HTH-type transcriptional regulator YbbH [Peptococcaceae bacterium CEB3]